MEYLRNIYPVFKPIGHLSIVSFDIALTFYYYRIEEDTCFAPLRLWIYGQCILHAWLGICSFYILLERTVPFPPVYLGNLLSLVLKFWWVLYAMFIFYSARACMTLAPLLYWSVGGGALILSMSLVIEWGKPIAPTPESRNEAPPAPPTLPEIPFRPNTPGKLELCSICIEFFKPDENISVLSCDHFYHPSCIYEWLQKNLHCPLCRTPVEPGPPRNSLERAGLAV